MRNATTLALALFRFLEERGIAYCVVGDSRSYPYLIDSDLDIVVPQEALAGLDAVLLAFCARHGLRLVQCLRHEQNACYYVLSWPDEHDLPAFLIPDVCGDYHRGGRRLLRAGEILNGRVPAVDDGGRPRGFFVPAPALEFIYYLVKRIDKGSLEDEQGGHLSAQWRLDPDGARAQLARFWGAGAHARTLAQAAEADDWGPVRQALPRLRAALRAGLAFSPAAWLGEMRRRAGRWLHPTGCVVALLGPDGSGKSSLIRHVAPALAPAFRRTRVLHLRPRLGQRGQARPVTDPHGAPPRSGLASAAKVLYFALDYAAGYLWTLRPLLVRSTLILFDRYYHDLLVDPRRYRYAAPPSVARRVGALIPRPDLWLVLDAPARALQQRKAEVPPEESARQRQEYLRFAEGRDDAVVVDTSGPAAQATARACAAVLDHLARRTARRLAAPAARNPGGTRFLLFFCRHRVPLLSRMVRIVFNCDIYCRLPASVILAHPYGIVIHSKALVGERVTIMQQVTIGTKDPGEDVAPVIGDGAYVGAGARVLGAVRVGEGAVIGANAVVTRDVPPGATVVGANRIVERAEPEATLAHAPAPRRLAALGLAARPAAWARRKGAAS